MKNLAVWFLVVCAVSAISSYISYNAGYKKGRVDGMINYEIIRSATEQPSRL